MIKKITVLVLFCICLICSGCVKKEVVKDDLTVIKERGELIVGVKTDARPFGYYDENGKLIGFDIDLARIVAQGLLGTDYKIKFIPVTPSNRIMKLDSKEVDILIATMSATEQRRQMVNFSVPYYFAGQAMMVTKNSDISSLKNLKNKRVIIVFGSTSERNIRASIPGVVIIGFKTYPEAFRALKEGQGDAVIADDTILLGYALTDNTVKILPTRYSQEPYAVAFRKSDDSKSLEAKIDIILENLISTKRLEALQRKWKIKVER